MINANELRIGNLVKSWDSSRPLTVKAIKHDENHFEGYYIEFDGGEIALQAGEDFYPVEGIPLSEKWLLRFGFESMGFIGIYFHPVTSSFELYNISPQNGGFKIVVGCKKNMTVFQISKQIQYVHQLQNLYYALTQTELELKK